MRCTTWRGRDLSSRPMGLFVLVRTLLPSWPTVGGRERPTSIPASSSSVTSATTHGSSLGGGRSPNRGGRKADPMNVVLLSMQDERDQRRAEYQMREEAMKVEREERAADRMMMMDMVKGIALAYFKVDKSKKRRKRKKRHEERKRRKRLGCDSRLSSSSSSSDDDDSSISSRS